MPSRENQSRVTVSVDGVSLGAWEQRTGGESNSASTQYSLAGMGPRISLGGRQEVSDVVVRKLYDADIQSRFKWLAGRVGKAKAVVADQRLDDEGNALGDPLVWTGTLKYAKAPDSNSDSDAAGLCELQIAISGPIT